MNVSFIGSHLLALAFPVALFSGLFYLIGFRQKRANLVVAAQRGTYLTFGLITAAVFVLVGSFLTNNFSLSYVHSYSSRSLPLYYKFAGLWAGLNGSILFWTWLVSLYGAIVLTQNRKKYPDWMPVINAVMMTVILFFLGLMIFANNPFTPLPQIPEDGTGLNPLLQNLAMSVHPPSLYLGFTGFTVPFAFVIAALTIKRLDSTWIDLTRKWTIIAWGFLTLGLILGGAWAYVELGWGGFWAWDPVENAALMPWLLATAYLHSVMIQKKRGMLMAWNVSLVCLTFILTIFGTYLTRSGIVASVHAFSEGNLGPFFLGFLALTFLVSFYLIATRWSLLEGKPFLVSVFSKESAFLLNNVMLLVSALAVIWGTLFPTLTEAVTGQRVTVGIPFFNRIMAPIGLILLALMGVGPMISWKKATVKNVTANLVAPLAAGLVTFAVAVYFGLRQWYALGSVLLITFVFGTLIIEFVRGIRVMRIQKGLSYSTAFLELFIQSNKRYGGYIVHVGVLLIFMGIAGTIFKSEVDFSLTPGQSFDYRGYHFDYVRPNMVQDANKASVYAMVNLSRKGKLLAVMNPAKFIYFSSEQPTTEVAIHQTTFEDVYLIIGTVDPKTKRADFRLTLNPLITFIWIGGFVILMGVGILLAPRGLKAAGKTLVLALLLFPVFPHSGKAAVDAMAPPVHQEEGGDPFAMLPPTDPRSGRFRGLAEKILCQCGGCVRMSLATCTCAFAKKEKEHILAILDNHSDGEILGEFVDKYGLTVLTTPPEKGFFRLGYWMPPLMTAGGLIWGVCFIWKRRRSLTPSHPQKLQPANDSYASALKKELEES